MKKCKLSSEEIIDLNQYVCFSLSIYTVYSDIH